MAYERLNLKTDDLLDEAVFKHIDDAIQSLDSAILTETVPEAVELTWRDGGIIVTTGKDDNAANRKNTVNYIPIGCCMLNVPTTAKFYIVGYDDDLTCVGSVGWNNGYGEYNVKSMLKLYSSATLYRISVDTTVNDGSSFTVNYDTEIIKTGIIPDIEELQSIVGVPSEAKDVEVTWENGGIDSNNGTNSSYNADLRLRTQGYIDINVSKITLSSNVAATILFYDDAASFISHGGIWATYSGSINIAKIAPTNAAYYRMAINLSTTPVTSDNFKFSTPAGQKSGLLKQVEDLVSGGTGSGKPNEIIVDCNGNGDYTTIEEALANAGDTETNHVIIRVMQGTYYPAPKTGSNNVPYPESYRNLSIIGDNKNKVILRGDCGYYYYQINVDYAPLRLNGNVVIENLTIESYSSNYETVAAENGWDLTSPHCRAYCIHVNGSRRAGDVTLIKNCRLINDHFTTVGFGLRANATLRFEDCDMIMTVSNNSLSDGSRYGTLYGHLAAGVAALNQRLEVINCRIVNNSYSQAINLMDGSGQTTEGACSATVQLIGNVCKTTDTQNGFQIANGYGYYTMDDLCYGNNITSMNVTQ